MMCQKISRGDRTRPHQGRVPQHEDRCRSVPNSWDESECSQLPASGENSRETARRPSAYTHDTRQRDCRIDRKLVDHIFGPSTLASPHRPHRSSHARHATVILRTDGVCSEGFGTEHPCKTTLGVKRSSIGEQTCSSRPAVSLPRATTHATVPIGGRRQLR